jgi:sugar lactone lactonase YvrE
MTLLMMPSLICVARSGDRCREGVVWHAAEETVYWPQQPRSSSDQA